MNAPLIFLSLTIAMVGIGFLGIAAFGLKNVAQGKHETQKIIMVLIPFVILLVSYLITGAWTDAGLLTMIITIGILGLIIALSGLRNTFNF